MTNTYSNTFPSTHRFIKWQEPEVMDPSEPNPPEEKNMEWMKYWLFRTSDLRVIPDPRLVDYVSEYKRCQRKETIPWKSVQAFMEIMFPTKYWVEDGVRFKQKVSIEQVTRTDLKEMNERLDLELTYRQSQTSTPYCPIRFALHMELFDELIRQLSITSPSRGFLLNRVRGELNQTLDSFRQVLDVSLAEEGKDKRAEKGPDVESVILLQKLDDAETGVKTQEEERNAAQSDYNDIMLKIETFERICKQSHEPEIEFQKRLNENVERQLALFDNPPNFSEEEDDLKALMDWALGTSTI